MQLCSILMDFHTYHVKVVRPTFFKVSTILFLVCLWSVGSAVLMSSTYDGKKNVRKPATFQLFSLNKSDKILFTTAVLSRFAVFENGVPFLCVYSLEDCILAQSHYFVHLCLRHAHLGLFCTQIHIYILLK